MTKCWAGFATARETDLEHKITAVSALYIPQITRYKSSKELSTTACPRLVINKVVVKHMNDISFAINLNT